MGSRTGFSDGREELEPLLPPKSVIREYVEIILTCLLFILFLRTYVLQQSDIPSGSMEDTILVGDYIIVNRFLYAPTLWEWERFLLPVREIRRSDVVVFKHPPDPARDFIKRVVGVPGDTVELRRGFLFVNGEPVEEPYLNELYRQASSFGPVTVPSGQYFLLGDHRNHSSDSRVWGPVPQGLIKGRALLVLFSTDAAPDPDRPPDQVTLRSMGSKLYNLVFRSRWDRAFRAIR